MVADWVLEEFEMVSFSDKRLNDRLKRCISQAACIGESTPDRAKSNADLKGTYRLVDNPKVNMNEILSVTTNRPSNGVANMLACFSPRTPPRSI